MMNLDEAATWQEDRLMFSVFAVDAADRTGESLKALAASLSATLIDATCAHLWQRDTLRLGGIDTSSGSVSGQVRVGDNIDDEWFALQLLVDAVDRLAPRHALAVSDADGEFLLIEAAAALPTWLEPATSGNRLFRFGGAWRLLDEARDDSLAVDVALRRLGAIPRGDATQCAAPSALAAAIDARLAVHPAQGRAHSRHRVRCRVPKDVARVLHAVPQLVAPAVAVFYLREPRDIAAASRMARFGSTQLVDTHVRFSRCLYSQLAQQQFFVPRGTAFVVPPDGDPHQHACQIGMQLACALEMLVARAPAAAAAAAAAATRRRLAPRSSTSTLPSSSRATRRTPCRRGSPRTTTPTTPPRLCV
jgi:hypothetical protein